MSSPPMTDRSVGGVIVVGARESRAQGEGRQEVNVFLVDKAIASSVNVQNVPKVKL